MDKDLLKNFNSTDQDPDIESWEDDCGLADLARDQLSQLEQLTETSHSTLHHGDD